MIKILENHCTPENGLLLFDPPTGSGKTYNVLKWIFENYKEYCKEGRKIFFITNLKKNLPIQDLREDFFRKNKKLNDFNKHVLFLNSNAGFAIEHFTEVRSTIPEYFTKLSAYWDFKNQIEFIYRLEKLDGFKDVLSKAKNEFRNRQEPEFRRRIELYLKENFTNKREKLTAIKTDPNLKWIGGLYPSVFSSERKIFFLSIDKFYAQNSTLVEPSYHFMNNDITKDAMIFIDEIDASKDSILKNIIRKGKQQKIDYIHLFNEIYWALSNNRLPQDFLEHSQNRQSQIENGYKYLPLENIESELTKKAEEIVEKFKLKYSFKTAVSAGVSRERNLLFHDFHYHSVYRNDKKFIEIDSNEIKKLNHLKFTNNAPENQQKNIITLLTQVKGFVSYFQGSVKSLAQNYQETINERRKSQDAEYGYDLALSSVLEEFRLEGKYKMFIMDTILSERERTNPREKKKEEIQYDFSIYENGFRYYDFIDDEQHETITKTFIYNFNNTPEKFLLKLSERAKVIGISATANVETVTGNYDISYLKKQLGDKFCQLSTEEKLYLKSLVQKQTSNYDKVKIQPIWIKNTESVNEVLEDFTSLFDDVEMAQEIIGLINNPLGFNQNRYYRIAKAFDHFLKNKDINAMLCLLNKEPKEYDDKLRRSTLERIFDELIFKHKLQDQFKSLDKDGKETYKANNSYVIVNSADFERKKDNFISHLEKGQKLFIISMYQTMGAGQNIHYLSPNKSSLIDIRSGELEKFNTSKTDINAIYLDKPTHLIQLVNKKLNEEGFIRYLFQLEFLLEAGRISLNTLNKEVTRAFQNLMASINSKAVPNKTKDSLYDDYNIKQHYSKFVIQAIGRICRTNLKAKNIYILADEKLKKEIKDYDVESNIVLNEFKELVKSCSSNSNRTAVDFTEAYVNKGNTSNRRALAYIRKFINRQFEWREREIKEWQQLRDLCLMFPTMSEDRARSLIRVLDIYVELPNTKQELNYIQERDFQVVNVDFSNELPFSVSAKSARLDELMVIPGVKDYFKYRDYATQFQPGKFVLTPVIFQNIYKGALGEEIGRFIFENHLNIKLEEMPPEHFERFDYKIRDKDIYIDFKHWQEYTEFDADSIREKISVKLKKVNGIKAIIVNILATSNYSPISSNAGAIIEIGNLYDTENNKFNDEAVELIMKNI
ncbi:hypothetical protein LX97_00533 [Nonlabens dokdonensis]|uniref:Helicase/UvrB N-terminal domain-containing protein n=2 Tax=Nonlabens dokdonensis TaxID=328515 RepID=L7W6W4_NONDD|nr:hypothetical protein [Nonlabens dokdonensis]AGC75849.1 hypothetical protein DDD_0722 [Nonlabens dokdonensis DSW-6]PZX43532.1 hypothetical protein LX97_00533 [Nonlabens dokdonensis]